MTDLVSPTDPPGVVSAGAARSRVVSQFGVVVFLASDIMLFAPFFAAYFLLRENNPPWPPDGVHLDVARAAIATMALVASSFTLVVFDRAREHDARAARRWLLITIALGAAFLVNQLAEYATLDFRADDHVYGSAYWMLTGLHGFHVAAGLAAMSMLFVRTVRSRSPDAVATWASGISLFWHLVDVIWLFVFATIWLLQ